MNKLNKKGFTLIEMLVVIAIIAVLVSIIIPTVTSATDKAAAATNAANLRSVKAELVTAYLTNDSEFFTINSDNTVTFGDKASKPAAKACGGLEIGDEDILPEATYDKEKEAFTVFYGNPENTIEAFAKVAEGSEDKDTIKAAS